MGKVAIVTGAAGGIGGAVVSRLLDRGYSVVAEDISDAVDQYDGDPRVAVLKADVSLLASAKEAVRLAVSTFGGLDLLVNNAGVFLRKPIAEVSVDEWDRLIAINARGPFLHSQQALPALAERAGCIVNVGSISGIVGLAGQSVYSATKGAVLQLTRQLAIEAAPSVRVNAVAPGAVDTEFMAAATRGETQAEADVRRATSLAAHPLGRISTPGEVADAIVFLASAEASGITGTVLSVDGGYVAR